jgi:hypothetical protein
VAFVGVAGKFDRGMQQFAIAAEQQQQWPLASAQNIRQLETVFLVRLVEIDTGYGVKRLLGWTKVH